MDFKNIHEPAHFSLSIISWPPPSGANIKDASHTWAFVFQNIKNNPGRVFRRGANIVQFTQFQITPQQFIYGDGNTTER